MAPKKIVKGDKDTKIRATLAFAESLSSRISSKAFNDATIGDLRAQIKSLPFPPCQASAAHAAEFDAKGLELWNAATRLRQNYKPGRRVSGDQDNGRQASIITGACLTRVYAFLLLEAAWSATRKRDDGGHQRARHRFQDTVRITKVALKAGKSCIVQEEMDLATKLLERAAVLTEELSKLVESHEDEDNVRVVERLTSEYYILRTTLAWKHDRLEIAEHMYAKAEPGNRHLDAISAEELADTLFEMGRDLLNKKQDEVAIRWLDRAFDILSSQELEILSIDAGDLRLSVLQSLVKALLAQRSAETRQRALDYLGLMEQDYPEKLVVSLLRLELLLSEEPIDCEQYFTVIIRMVRSMTLMPVNLKTLLYHLHKLKSLQPDLAAKALDELLHQRLLQDLDKDEWIEKVLLTRLWVACDTPGPNIDRPTQTLHELFDAVLHVLRQPISVTATHGAQTLLWRHIDATFTSRQFSECSQWCQLSLHKLLENCGEINKSKLTRKLIMCSLSAQDFDAARQTFFNMSENGKSNPLTRFLMYKVGLRTGDADFAMESLETVCKATSQDASLLYACVVEAQTVGDKHQAALALQKVLRRCDQGTPDGVNLPALLRCMVRLLVGDAHGDQQPTDQALEELCQVFGIATKHAKVGSQSHNVESAVAAFDEKELQWFARSSYNMALRLCANVHPNYLISLLNSCSSLVALLLQQMPEQTDRELQLRSVHCFWLMACAQITIARAEDEVEASSQAYLEVRKCGTTYRARMTILLNNATVHQDDRNDLLEKNFQLVKFEVEAALKLHQWDEVDKLFEQCWAHDHAADTQQWDTLADLVLVLHAAMVEAKLDAIHLRKILAVLQTIINKSERLKSGDTKHLARWLRCLFQIASGFEEAACLQCLEQSHVIANRRQGTNDPFPNVELEWLATTAFNRAVDHYCASDDVRTKLWAEKAMILAGDVNDGGSLQALLRDKYSGLSWGD